MGVGDFLKDGLNAVQSGSNWVDENVFGTEDEETRYVERNGKRYPMVNKPGGARDNVISRNIGKPVQTGLERALHGMTWLYDNGISQPMSTFLLAGQNAESKGFDELFKASTWIKAWDVAENVSPGQAFWANHREVQDILKDQPVYARPAPAYLPPGFDELSRDEQDSILKEMGMPVVGNRAVEKMQQEMGWFNFASGATDFAARWWLDPVVLGAKVVGGVRTAAAVKPRPRGGWSQQDIDHLMHSSPMAKAGDYLWRNRDNGLLLSNLSMFRKSALGPRGAGIVGTLRSREEVDLFLRTSMGDVAARSELEAANITAAQRLQQDTARLAELDMDLARVAAQSNPRARAMVQTRMDELNRQINADEALTSRYGAMLEHYGELDALNLTRFSFSRAERRTRAQMNYKVGAGLGAAKRPTAPGDDPTRFSRVYGNDYFGNSLTVVRSFAQPHPTGYIKVDDLHPEALDELRGQVARIPGVGPDVRLSLMNKYLATRTEGERLDVLDEIGVLGTKKVAEKHGFSADEAQALYAEHRSRITKGQEALRRYATASHPGEQIHVDEFMGAGGKLTVHPNMVSRLANDHVMIDFDALDTVLRRHSGALKALKNSSGATKDWITDGADYFNHLWKFATLFRLGYIPRVLGDDITGQIARLGATSMALRTGYGAKNLATNLAHWRPDRMREAEEAALRQSVTYADDEIRLLQPRVDELRGKTEARREINKQAAIRARERLRYATNRMNALGPDASPATIGAHQRLVAKHKAAADKAERVATAKAPRDTRLEEMDERLGFLSQARDNATRFADEIGLQRKKGFRQQSQLYGDVRVAPGTVLPAAFQGKKGEYYQKMISSDDSLRTLLATNKKMIHGNLVRSFSHSGQAVSYPQAPELFVKSWHQAINNQIMQDPLALQAVKGATIPEMTRWLSTTPAGRAYRKRLGLKYNSNERIASSVYHDVAEYMPDDLIRKAALEEKADVRFLTDAAARGIHPQNVHTTQLAENLAGSNHLSRGIDRIIDGWYKTMVSMPADRMSRHPLYNQLYEGHARNLFQQEMKQRKAMVDAGGYKPSQVHRMMKFGQKDADRLTEAARRLALKDTRNLVFDIAHRSDAAHMLRFTSPFFAATTEAWQRWSRIIADRPQTVGYAAMFFNAPASAGWLQDSEGNVIRRDGTVTVPDPNTGKLVERFVPKAERRILARMPKFVADGPLGKALGMDASGAWSISQDSMNLITQGDPWFNPGTGPIVSIPVNEFVKDKPAEAEVARHLGVLPFGPTAGSFLGQNPLGRAAELSLPMNVKNFLTAWDTSDERYQRVKLQIMQKAAYEHAALGKPMPSAKEIADQTRNYWLFSAVSAFTQPFATAKPDKYQFFRDQYNNLRRRDPRNADQEFLDRFGESYFIFAQSTSKSSGAPPPTKRAVELSKQYEGLIAKNPELAALIVGPEGEGPFSPEAYVYQLTTPLVPGGSEMQRTKMSAEEAMAENQRRLGWAKYTAAMNRITAKLHSAGFDSFSDDGAEELAEEKRAFTRLYSEPTYPDGTPNPHYNPEWAEDFYTFSPKKYDQLIPALTEVARSDLAANPDRSDLRVLQEYLGARQALLGELAARGAEGGAKTLSAKANSDLSSRWAWFVDGLIERDTRFGDLYHRYLSRDLGVDVEDLAEGEQEEEVTFSGAL